MYINSNIEDSTINIEFSEIEILILLDILLKKKKRVLKKADRSFGSGFIEEAANIGNMIANFETYLEIAKRNNISLE